MKPELIGKTKPYKGGSNVSPVEFEVNDTRGIDPLEGMDDTQIPEENHYDNLVVSLDERLVKRIGTQR